MTVPRRFRRVGAGLRLGTRGSRLALAQAEIAIDALRSAGLEAEFELVVVRTKGD